MIKKIDHIAIAVRNLQESRKKIEDLFDAKFIVEKVNPEGQYKVAIFQVGESTFSMLEPTSPEGFVAKHIERYGETAQHMGLEVNDLDEFIEHLHSKGVKTATARLRVSARRSLSDRKIPSASSCRFSNGSGNTNMHLRRSE